MVVIFCYQYLLFNMLLIKMKKMEDPNTFKTMTKDWIWENIPSYQSSPFIL